MAKKSKITRPEEIGSRYAEKVDQIVNNWTAVKPKLPERWQTEMNRLFAEHGGVKPHRVENFRIGIEKVTPEKYREAVQRGAQVIARNWIRALAASPKV
ncbi:MAG: hypothetical protein QXW35_02765 [Candidatus Aenigmatarchaeota archaeon]